MIEQLANMIAKKMEEEKLINYEMREHYEYALITIIERTLTIATLIVISFFMHEVISSLLFLITFFSLRKRTGGYHAKKFYQCYFETILTYISVIFLSFVLINYIQIVYVCLFFAVIFIYKIGTINHPNMEMEHGELIEMKKKARRMVIFQSGLILMIRFFYGANVYVCIMSMAIILCATLMFVAKIKKQEVC